MRVVEVVMAREVVAREVEGSRSGAEVVEVKENNFACNCVCVYVCNHCSAASAFR